MDQADEIHGVASGSIFALAHTDENTAFRKHHRSIKNKQLSQASHNRRRGAPQRGGIPSAKSDAFEIPIYKSPSAKSNKNFKNLKPVGSLFICSLEN